MNSVHLSFVRRNAHRPAPASTRDPGSRYRDHGAYAGRFRPRQSPERGRNPRPPEPRTAGPTMSTGPEPRHQHGVDHFDATFARDLVWAQRLREQLAELPTTDDER
ncbi:hypothetical protein GCM10020366_33420 [Saccharopolyspora gregorii]|uniref:Uncharacterized protein n=1 Tax=Saccharopolyspora gregorii TaxID=33914 RepID=A0ABP6RST0_9PSEU